MSETQTEVTVGVTHGPGATVLCGWAAGGMATVMLNPLAPWIVLGVTQQLASHHKTLKDRREFFV